MSLLARPLRYGSRGLNVIKPQEMPSDIPVAQGGLQLTAI
ncbi:hypothetical protein [Caudoviricetes sp.]|nr:hypothetical protein [Caudoviricetes sp.]UOF79116.1 hypothetical protein [Caudoviricetes sp.]